LRVGGSEVTRPQFLYQVLRLLRDRVLLVWTLGFPIVLSLIFMAMFSNPDKVYAATPTSSGARDEVMIGVVGGDALHDGVQPRSGPVGLVLDDAEAHGGGLVDLVQVGEHGHEDEGQDDGEAERPHEQDPVSQERPRGAHPRRRRRSSPHHEGHPLHGRAGRDRREAGGDHSARLWR